MALNMPLAGSSAPVRYRNKFGPLFQNIVSDICRVLEAEIFCVFALLDDPVASL